MDTPKIIGLISQIINSSLANRISRGYMSSVGSDWVYWAISTPNLTRLHHGRWEEAPYFLVFFIRFCVIGFSSTTTIMHIHLCIFHSSSLIPFVEIYQCCPSVTHLHWYMMFSRSLCLSIYSPLDRYMSSENPTLDWMIFSASKLFSFQLLQPILPL